MSVFPSISRCCGSCSGEPIKSGGDKIAYLRGHAGTWCLIALSVGIGYANTGLQCVISCQAAA